MKKLEIYIHIPFCVKKCDYCDFLSAPADGRTKRLYFESIKKEIKMSYFRFAGYETDTVFIGGGTPSILSSSWIREIIDTLRQNANISDDAEITIECNPGTVTREKLLDYRQAGINRISFGLQTANDAELKSIGRIHTFTQFLESYELARECGFDNINVDIMSALPGQTVDSYRRTVEKVLELNPEHISAYSLIVEEDTILEKRVSEALEKGINILPNEDEERQMYYLTKELLQKKGYLRYEISNYAKKGYECRHNVGYWKRTEYLGFGVGAASLYKGERFNNTDDIYCYINSLYYEETAGENENFFEMYDCEDGDEERNVLDDVMEDEYNQQRLDEIETARQKLTQKDEMEEFMFLGLRMTEGISTEEFGRKFGRPYESVYGKVTEDLIQKKLLEKQNKKIKLTDRGIDVSNRVMSEFLL